MRKVLSFSLFLMLGLVASQLLPGALGTAYPGFKATADTLLYICLGFIMINVGSAAVAADRPLLYFRTAALRPLDRLRGVEGESAAEPFRGPDLGRYPLHDARRVKPEKQLDIP